MKKLKPSQEQMWLKNFPEGASDTPLPKKKVDEYFSEINKEHLNDIGLITTVGEELTWGEVEEGFLKTSNSLIGMDLKPGDNVAISLLNTTQLIYSIFACSKSGLTVNMINPFAEPKEVISRIQMKDAKILIAQDKFIPLFSKIKEVINVNHIVTTPIVAGATNKGQEPLDRNVGWWDDFIESGRYNTKKVKTFYDKRNPFIYTHSSGSTGPTKPIELGHDTFTHTAHMHAVAGMNFKRGNRWLSTIPGIFSTGINTSILLPILLGMTTILEYNYDRQVFLSNLKRFLPQYTVATKYFWNGIFEDEEFEGLDLSPFIYPTIGGEKLRRHEIRRYNKFGEEHNYMDGWKNGYGQCELGGGVGTSANNVGKKALNTIGNPYTHNTIVVTDLETGEELDYNKRGEIKVKTTTGMFEYVGMPEKTAEYYKDGLANLGDIGYVDEEGNYFIDGRISEFIKLSANEKLYPYEVEDVVEDLMEDNEFFDSAIRNYCVHGIEQDGVEIPVLQLQLSEECVDRKRYVIVTIDGAIKNRLPRKKQISAYKVRKESFPVSPAGKYIIAPFKAETDGFERVDENQELKPFELKSTNSI